MRVSARLLTFVSVCEWFVLLSLRMVCENGFVFALLYGRHGVYATALYKCDC